MKIAINDKRKIFVIQEEFNQQFPFLKIEFYSKPNTKDGPPSKKLIKHHNKTLNECRTIHKAGAINITPQMTVSNLEHHLNDIYGLSVQIFRKSGRVWLEATVTDGWTLEEQNHQGEMLSNPVSKTA